MSGLRRCGLKWPRRRYLTDGTGMRRPPCPKTGAFPHSAQPELKIAIKKISYEKRCGPLRRRAGFSGIRVRLVEGTIRLFDIPAVTLPRLHLCPGLRATIRCERTSHFDTFLELPT